MALNPQGEPTKEEKRLMVLTGIKTLKGLMEFLSSPDSSLAEAETGPPDSAYQLAEENAQEEADVELLERLYKMSPPPE